MPGTAAAWVIGCNLPEAFTIGPMLLPTRPMSVLLSLLIAIWVSGRIARYTGLEQGWIQGAAETSAWLGLIGARLGFVIANWSAFRDAPWTALYFWQPGYLPYTGVLLGGAYALWRLSQRHLGERMVYLRALGGGFAMGTLFLGGVLVSMGLLVSPNILRIGDKVPDFTLQTLNGEKVSFSNLEGRGVVINFWATWCPPCRREMPLLDAVQEKYGSRGLSIVGIDLHEPPAAVRKYVESIGVKFPIWVDAPQSRSGFDRTSELFNRFGGVGLPTTFFIYRNGTIQSVHIGELNRATLQNRAEEILTE